MIRSPVVFLILLTGLNLLNYLDRLILPAVLPKVQEELGLSNFVGGLAAAIFLIGYFVASPIFGKLGDTGKRKNLIAIGVLVWSVATMASGLAKGTASLLCVRAIVGVGEASYATLAPTIIDDVTPKDKKGMFLGIFYSAAPIGSALGYLVGGFVEKHWSWHHAFYVAGIPGVVLALLCLLMHEPERTVSEKKKSLLESVRVLSKMSQFRRGVLGYCAYTAAVGAFSFWAPKFLYAHHGMPLDKANFAFGLVTVVAGFLGTLLGGALADSNERKVSREDLRDQEKKPDTAYRDPDPALVRDHESPEKQAYRERKTINGLLRICALGSLIGAPLAAVAFLAPTPKEFFGVVFFCEIALFLGSSPINAVALRAVPTELRASAMALQIFAIHLLGDLWSPALLGLIADVWSIGLAVLVLPIAIALSAYLWWPRAREAEAPA